MEEDNREKHITESPGSYVMYGGLLSLQAFTVLISGIWGYAILPVNCTNISGRRSIKTLIMISIIMICIHIGFVLCSINCVELIDNGKGGKVFTTKFSIPTWLYIFIILSNFVIFVTASASISYVKNKKNCQGKGYLEWTWYTGIVGIAIPIVVIIIASLSLNYRLKYNAQRARSLKALRAGAIVNLLNATDAEKAGHAEALAIAEREQLQARMAEIKETKEQKEKEREKEKQDKKEEQDRKMIELEEKKAELEDKKYQLMQRDQERKHNLEMRKLELEHEAKARVLDLKEQEELLFLRSPSADRGAGAPAHGQFYQGGGAGPGAGAPRSPFAEVAYVSKFRRPQAPQTDPRHQQRRLFPSQSRSQSRARSMRNIPEENVEY